MLVGYYGGESPEVWVVVADDHRCAVVDQPVDPVCFDSAFGQGDGVRLGNHWKRFNEVGELLVAHASCLGQVGWLRLESGAALLIPRTRFVDR
jgi:hypothetical protein